MDRRARGLRRRPAARHRGHRAAVTGVEGKAKLSQNRSDADRDGVVAGLAEDAQTRLVGSAAANATEVAQQMDTSR